MINETSNMMKWGRDIDVVEEYVTPTLYSLTKLGKNIDVPKNVRLIKLNLTMLVLFF